MAKTTTGANPWLAQAGQSRFNELLRQGHELHRELTSVPGDLTTVDLLREVQTAAGNPSAGVPPTFGVVAGLTGLAASLELPDAWNKRLAPGSVPLKDSERMVWLRDVPATATERADVVLLTDRIKFDDPIYGAGKIFAVSEVRSSDAARLIRVKVRYAHQES